jgi:hypothetical protein
LFLSEKLLLLSVSDHFGLFVVKNLLSVRNLARHTRSTVSCVSVSDFVKKRALEHAIWLSSPDFPELPIFHGELLNNPYIQRDNLRSYLSFVFVVYFILSDPWRPHCLKLSLSWHSVTVWHTPAALRPQQWW